MSETQLATAPVNPGFHKATSALSATLGIEPRMMVETLKKQCFPSMSSEQISDAQLAAFISVANTLELNPLIPGMLYGYPTKSGGILPISGPDAILKKLDEYIEKGKLEGYECVVYPEDPAVKPTHAIASIWRKGSERPATFTAVFGEWSVGSNPNWVQRPRHMIWLRAIKQCARQVIHGVPLDRDDMEIADLQNVTPDAPTPPVVERPAAPTRSKKGAAAVVENPPEKQQQATNIVEGEFTQEKAPEPKPDADAAAKAAKAAEDAKLAADMAAREAKLKTPAKETPKEPAKPEAGRAFLNDGEEITATCTVVDVSTCLLKKAGVEVPAVQVELKGGFVGMVFHIGGATGTNDKNLAPLPVWAPGAAVKVKLQGKKNMKTGKVVASVVEVLPEAAEAVEME